MDTIKIRLQEIFDRIPRRHTDENVKLFTSIITDYEDVLIEIEAINSFYEKLVPLFFDELEEIKALFKKANDKKISKKGKDDFFNEAALNLKDSIEKLITLYADGTKV